MQVRASIVRCAIHEESKAKEHDEAKESESIVDDAARKQKGREKMTRHRDTWRGWIHDAEEREELRRSRQGYRHCKVHADHRRYMQTRRQGEMMNRCV